MSPSAWKLPAALALAAVAGCGQSAAVDDEVLSNSEAAAMVVDETVNATPAAFNAEGAPTVTFSVPDMMCEQSCVPTVRETLAEQAGVKEVKVELATKTATVAVDEEVFDADAAVATLVDLKFTETKLVTADAANAAAAKPGDGVTSGDEVLSEKQPKS